jgi:nucleoside-triphosphatase THEP1
MKLAAMVYNTGEGQRADALLYDLADQLAARGLKLAGAVQKNGPGSEFGCSDMYLRELATGRTSKTSQFRGKGASGCRLDSSALEDVVGLARNAIGPDVDLVIVNKFGKQEVEGNGFRAVIEAAVTEGCPVLVGLRAEHVPDWTEFAGGEGEVLALDEKAVRAWCNEILALRPRA